jgi:tetratricopeptide (TPR) repeat protein
MKRRSHTFVLAMILVFGCGGSQPEPVAPTAPPPEPEPEPVVEATPEPPPEIAPAPTPGMTLASIAQGAVLLENLGTLHREVTTESPEAQAFFDQGLRLMYGFNHDEAARSFARGGAIDASCAMCFWGAAYTLGPNYNIPMLPDRAAAAWEALLRAQVAAAMSTPVEQALIGTLSRRYAGPQYLDPPAMQPHVEAYAAAMGELVRRFPNDVDVLVLAAEAAMNVRPWQLWSHEGDPAPGTEEIVSMLETALRLDVTHPGANHYYIHAVEASRNPDRAVRAADRLPGLMPAAGHTVHMPAHIYQRVGRYADASEANRRAIVADRAYLEAVTPIGYYPIYLGHNYGFLAYSASMLGRRAEALEASRHSAEMIPRDIVCGMPGMDFFLSEPYLVMVRFGMWDELLAEPPPPEQYAVLSALYRHAHGMALAARDRFDEARADLAIVRRTMGEIPADMLTGLNPGQKILELAAKILEARIAERTHAEDAIAAWELAVAMEDALAYSEPSDWFYPTRHFLGAALLDANRGAEAEAVYRADLERNPKNGWAYFGLVQAFRAQRKNRDAATAERMYRQAFRQADVRLERSAY